MNKKIIVENKKIEKLIEKYNPIIFKLLNKIAKEDGGNVSLTLGSSIATSLMAYLLFIVQEHGSNVDEYSKLLTDEVNRKLLEAQKFNGKNYNNTCQPLH